MLKHSTSLATLFGRSVCPLFLGTALVVAPSVAQAQSAITIDATSPDLTATNGGEPDPGAGDTLTVEEGTTLDILDDGVGLYATGADGITIINNGTIETEGGAGTTGAGYSATVGAGYANGILLEDTADALIINNGTIQTDDYWAEGVRAQTADNLVVINNGLISVLADRGIGVFATRSDAVSMFNNGTIEMLDVSSPSGMSLAGFDATVTPLADAAKTGHLMVNSGLIQATKTLTNSGIYGMDLVGVQIVGGVSYRYIVDSEMSNYGTIRVSLDTTPGTSGGIGDASGMVASAHNVDMYNYGTIHLESTGRGMEADGSGLGVYNYGTIIVDGGNAATPATKVALYAVGMDVTSDRTLLFVDDTLTTTNTYRSGGTEGEYRNKVVNAGLIQVNISNNAPDVMSAGVRIAGDSGQDFYNYGAIISTNGWSIVLDADETQGQGVVRVNNLYLFDGSILVGDINVNPAADDEWRLTFGDGYSAAVRFETATNLRRPGFYEFYLNRYASDYKGHFPDFFVAPNGYALIDNVAYTFDLESYSQQDQATWSMVSMIQDAVDGATENLPPSGDFAFNGDSGAGMSNKWAQMFAGWVRDPGDGEVGVGSEASDEHEGGFNGYSAGTIIGVNMPERSYFLGAAYGKVDSIDWMDNDTGFDTQSGTLFGGIATTLWDRFDLSLTAGVSYNHSERDMADSRVSTGIHTMSSDYASVFLSPSLLIDGPIGSSLRLNYLGGWSQGHSYTLSGGEKLEVEQRLNHVVGAKFEMVQNIPKLSDRLRARFRYGAEASYADGEDIDSTLSLTGFTTTGEGLSTPYNNGFSAGAFAALDIGPAFIKASINSDEQVSVNAGLTLKF